MKKVIRRRKSAERYGCFEEGLSKPVQFLRGVGPRLSQKLERKNIRTIQDLLYYFPRTYEDRRIIVSVQEAQAGQKVTVVGRMKSFHPVFYSRSHHRRYEIVLEDLNNRLLELTLVYFYKPYFARTGKSGMIVAAYGEVEAFRQRKQMMHPEVEILGKTLETDSLAPGIFPVYSETEGLRQKTFRRILREALIQNKSKMKDSLPSFLCEKYGWPSLGDAIQEIHQPNVTLDINLLFHKKSCSC